MIRGNTVGVAVLLAGLSACHTASSRATAAVPQTAELSLSRATKTLADSVAARKSALELERVRVLSKFEPWSNQAKAVDDKIFALDGELMRMPSVAAQKVIDHVIDVLERRDTGLQLELSQLRTKYSDDANYVKDAKEELLQLAMRREELQLQRRLYSSR